MEGVETLGNKLVTLPNWFKQLLLDGDTDVLQCCKSAVVSLLKAVESTHFNIKCSKEEFWSKVSHAQNNGKLTSIYQTALDRACFDAFLASSFIFVIAQDIVRGTVSFKNSTGNCEMKLKKYTYKWRRRANVVLCIRISCFLNEEEIWENFKRKFKKY